MSFFARATSRVAAAFWLCGLCAVAVVDCTQTDPCADAIELNPSLDVKIKIDQTQPDGMATITGMVELDYPCSKPEETYILKDMILYEGSDKTNQIAKVDLQFDGGSVVTTPTECSGLSTYAKKVMVTATGITNSQLSSYCVSGLTDFDLEGSIVRKACPNGAVQPLGSLPEVDCH